MRIHRAFAIAALLGLIQGIAQSPKPTEVAPGVTLPADTDAVVFALDQTSAGPALIHVKPHEVIFSSHATGNFLRSFVYAGPHSSSEVDGIHAGTVLASAKDAFYVRLSGEDAELARSRVHLIWLQPGKKRREITDFSMNIFGGQRNRFVDDVPVDTEMLPGTNWLKVTPKDPLYAGEYAIAFLPKDVNQYPDSVYDFGVPGSVGDANPYAPRTNDNSNGKKSAN